MRQPELNFREQITFIFVLVLEDKERFFVNDLLGVYNASVRLYLSSRLIDTKSSSLLNKYK